jgi:hypothetical protein
LHFGKTEIFLQKGLDKQKIARRGDLPVGCKTRMQDGWSE